MVLQSIHKSVAQPSMNCQNIRCGEVVADAKYLTILSLLTEATDYENNRVSVEQVVVGGLIFDE